MPRYIIKLRDEKTNTDYYMEWSTVVDAPTTYGMTLEEFTEYYKAEYGDNGMLEFPKRMERVEQFDCSAFNDSVQSLLEHNRAGDNETHLNKEQIIEKYCINRPDKVDKEIFSLRIEGGGNRINLAKALRLIADQIENKQIEQSDIEGSSFNDCTLEVKEFSLDSKK